MISLQKFQCENNFLLFLLNVKRSLSHFTLGALCMGSHNSQLSFVKNQGPQHDTLGTPTTLGTSDTLGTSGTLVIEASFTEVKDDLVKIQINSFNSTHLRNVNLSVCSLKEYLINKTFS